MSHCVHVFYFWRMNDDDESNVTFQRRSHQVLSGPVTLPSLPLPFPPLTFPSPFSSHPLFPTPSSSLPLEVGPSNTARGSGERCKLPQRGLGRSPSGKSNLVHFSLKIWYLVAQILLIFLRINWPKTKQKHLIEGLTSLGLISNSKFMARLSNWMGAMAGLGEEWPDC